MIEKLKIRIDRIKAKGFDIKVVDRRPPLLPIGIFHYPCNTELENLRFELSQIVFYKSDSLAASYENMGQYVTKIERLEYLEEHGEFTKDAEEIAEYILKEKNHL
jgi:uncharacterized protein (UPF0335 family)